MGSQNRSQPNDMLVYVCVCVYVFVCVSVRKSMVVCQRPLQQYSDIYKRNLPTTR